MIRIEAVESVIEWDVAAGRMLVLNPGDIVEVEEKLAKSLIEQNKVKKTRKAEFVGSADADLADQADTATDDAPAADTDAKPDQSGASTGDTAAAQDDAAAQDGAAADQAPV